MILLKLISLTSIWILGIKIITTDGMVLEKVGRYGQKKVDEGYRIFEPLWVCQWCMPSIHTLIGFLFAWGLGFITTWQWNFLIMYLVCAFATSLICGLVWMVYMLLNSIKQYYDNAQEYYYHATKNLKKQNGKSS